MERRSCLRRGLPRSVYEIDLCLSSSAISHVPVARFLRVIARLCGWNIVRCVAGIPGTAIRALRQYKRSGHIPVSWLAPTHGPQVAVSSHCSFSRKMICRESRGKRGDLLMRLRKAQACLRSVRLSITLLSLGLYLETPVPDYGGLRFCAAIAREALSRTAQRRFQTETASDQMGKGLKAVT